MIVAREDNTEHESLQSLMFSASQLEKYIPWQSLAYSGTQRIKELAPLSMADVGGTLRV